jgi:hypothetical protein
VIGARCSGPMLPPEGLLHGCGVTLSERDDGRVIEVQVALRIGCIDGEIFGKHHERMVHQPGELIDESVVATGILRRGQFTREEPRVLEIQVALGDART